MKKLILLFLLISVASYGQISNGTETKQNAFRSLNPQSVISPVFITTMGSDGTMGKASVNNLPLSTAVIAELDNIKSQINPNTYVVTDNGYTFVGNAFTLNSGWSWKINNVNNTNASTVVINVPFASSGLARIDLIVLNASNTAVRVIGVEAVTPVSPILPINTIQIAFIYSDATTHTPVIPRPRNPVSQQLRDGEILLAPSENVVFDALALKVDKVTGERLINAGEIAKLSNTSNTNTGDNAINTLYSGLVSNATHTGDATGSTALTVVKINGTSLSGLPTGLLKNTTGTGVPSIAVSGTDIKTVGGISILGSGDIPMSLPAPFVSTTSTNGKINGELNIGLYNPLKISMNGSASPNPNYADFTAPGSSNGAGWLSGHRFYTAWGGTLFPAFTVESISSSSGLATVNGNLITTGSANVGALTASGLLTPSTSPYILRSLNSNANAPFEMTSTYNTTGNYDTTINFNLIATSGGGYSNAFVFRLRPNNTPINETVEILRLDHNTSYPYVTINAPTTISSTLITTGYKISALNTAPSSATYTGTTGEIRITATYVYVCTATNTWVRTALTTW